MARGQNRRRPTNPQCRRDGSPVELREVLAEQRGDLDEARAEAAGGHRFGGGPMSPAAFAALAESEPLMAAAADYYADAIGRAPPHAAGWLLRIIREAVRALAAARGRPTAVGEDFGSALGSAPRAPVLWLASGGVWEVFEKRVRHGVFDFLEGVRRDGFVKTVLRHGNYRGVDPRARIYMPHGEYASLLVGAFEDPDPECRARAGPIFYHNYADPHRLCQSDYETRPMPADADLGPLRRALEDPVPGVRWWAAVNLSAVAPRTPGLADVLAEALSVTLPSAQWEDGFGWDSPQWEYGVGWDFERGCGWVPAAEALDRLGPEVWEALGPSAAPGLSRVLVGYGLLDLPACHAGWTLTAATLARLGAVSTDVLVRLRHVGSDSGRDYTHPGVPADGLRKTRDAYESLSDRLRRGAAVTIPGRPDEGFLMGIFLDPDDRTRRLAYADWLDEHDQPGAARITRLEVELEGADPNDPAHPELAEALADLRASHREWADVWEQLCGLARWEADRRAGGAFWPPADVVETHGGSPD